VNPRAPAASERLRAICLALPDATEQPMKRGPTYRICDKIFAMDRPHDGEPAVWCKAPPGSQAVLVGAEPQRFFVPPYVGAKGWIGMVLGGGVDWEEATAVITRSYRLVASRRYQAMLAQKP
jgi:predicted DNA-binding protein (MmcQ/YjbR family)